MILEMKRLILRPWEEGDAEPLYRYASDEFVGPMAGWPPHTSVEHSRAIIRQVLSKEGTFAVVLRETMEPVGSISIMLPGEGSAPMETGEAELGYWIGRPHWGKGLIPEAAEALLKRCFEELSVTAVWAYHFEGNEQSHRVMEKCGMTFHHADTDDEGRGRRFMRVSKAEWEKRNG